LKFNFPLKIFTGAYIFFTLLVLSCASSLKFPQIDFEEKASDWRSFRDKQCNQEKRDFNISLPLRLLWKKKVGPSYSTPLIIDDMVIIGSLDKKITFLELNSGDKLGSYPLSFPLSITPCAGESVLYFAGGESNSNIFALNLKSGELIWDKRLRGLNSSPTITKKALFAGTDRGELLCLDKINGKQLWKYKTGDFVYSAAVFADEALYFGSGDQKIYRLDVSSGDLIWSYMTNGAIYTTPCMDEKTLFSGSADGYFYALELLSGELLWKFKSGGSIRSSAVRSNGMVFFGSNDGNLYTLSSKDGKLVWSFETDGPIHSSPIVVGDYLFFGSLDGYVYGLNSSNGEIIFRYKTGGMIYASPSFYEGRILIASTDGYLYCFGR